MSDIDEAVKVFNQKRMHASGSTLRANLQAVLDWHEKQIRDSIVVELHVEKDHIERLGIQAIPETQEYFNGLSQAMRRAIDIANQEGASGSIDYDAQIESELNHE